MENLRSKLLSKKALLFTIIASAVMIVALLPAAYHKASATPSFCSMCHIIEPYYQSWNEGPSLAATHGKLGLKCIDCHKQTMTEKIRDGFGYFVGNYENPLKERNYSKEACLSCHQDDWEKIVQATAFDGDSNPHKSHLGDVNCQVCHNMHRKSELTCIQCHDHDWFKTLDKNLWNVPN